MGAKQLFHSAIPTKEGSSTFRTFWTLEIPEVERLGGSRRMAFMNMNQHEYRSMVSV